MTFRRPMVDTSSMPHAASVAGALVDPIERFLSMKYASLLKASVASAVVLAGTGMAFAADAPVYEKAPTVAAPAPVATPLWQGFYAGAFAGYAWGDTDVSHPQTGGTGYYFATGDYSMKDDDGFFGGGQVGYNWQMNQFVAGIEAEVGYMGIDDLRVDPFGRQIGFNDLSVETNGNLYSAITGRLGYSVNQFLVYAKGGAAFLDSAATYMDNCSVGATCGANQLWMDTDYEWEAGYTVGGGVEWALNDKLSAKAEYMYYDFGSKDVTGFDALGNTYAGSVDQKAHTVKVGLNYHF